MNTYLSSAQQALKDQFQEFARNEVAAQALALNRHEKQIKDFLQETAQKGYLGLTVPTEYGGKGASFLELIMFVEAIGQYEPGLGLAIGNHYAVVETIKKFGSETQKSRYLPLLARGELIGTMAFSEDNAGTDFEAVSATVKDGMLSGKKTLVVNGGFANLMLVLAKAEDKPALYLVDATPGKTVKVLREHNLLGLRSNDVRDIEFTAQKLSAESAIAKDQPVRETALYSLDVAKVVLAAAALGLLEGALELAVNHAKERQQFGTNIGQFQGVQWKLADLGVDTTATRLQTYRAAWSHDEKPEEFARHASMCKWFASRAAKLHSGEAMQILASAGLETDSPLERFYRDAKVMEIVQGTSEFQKMLLVKELDI